MQATSDEVLIGRIAKGDRLAMQVLFARHHVRVYSGSSCVWCGNESTAEDLISEVFLDVWRQADRFEGRSAVSTWLLAIARFKALVGACGAGRTRNWTTRRLPRSRTPRMTPRSPWRRRTRVLVLRKCLTALSAEHREIIDLVYYHEKSVEEVAEIVGIPENTVKTRMFYARKKLAELLKAAGIERGWP